MTSLQSLRGRRIGGDAPASTSAGGGGHRAAEAEIGFRLANHVNGEAEANASEGVTSRERPAPIPNPRGRTSPIGSRGPSRGQAVTPRSDLPPANISGRFGRICATSAAATPPNDCHPSPASLSRARTGRGGFVNIRNHLLRHPKDAIGVVGDDRQSGVKEREFVVPKMFAFGE